MEFGEFEKKIRMLGVVTLFNPDVQEAAERIKRYAPHLDALIVWDNSPLEANLQQQLKEKLCGDIWHQMIWQGTGENRCIAPAVNYAWHYATEHGFDLLLIMDQDSQWENFALYRQEVERRFSQNALEVFTPYIIGLDEWEADDVVTERNIFINSGTVIPVLALDALDGADETFMLDALDHDLSFRLRKRGYTIVCLTTHKLYHTLGHPTRSGILKIYSPNYGSQRTYSIVSSHLINYRKNRKWMTWQERYEVLKEFIFWKFVRIVMVENGKWERFKMYVKGIKDGLFFELSNIKP